MISVVSAISDEMKVKLAASGWPALTPHVNGSPGRIFLIDRHRLDQFMPPRVVFLPMKSIFTGRDTTRGPVRVSQNQPYDAQSKAAIAAKAFGGENLTFEVRVWGIASDDEDDPDGRDWDYTQAMYHALLSACDELIPGCYTPEGGVWETVAHLKRVGREFVFALTIGIPLLSKIATPVGASGRPFAPTGTGPRVTDMMISSDGTKVSPGCETDNPIGPEGGEALLTDTGGEFLQAEPGGEILEADE